MTMSPAPSRKVAVSGSEVPGAYARADAPVERTTVTLALAAVAAKAAATNARVLKDLIKSSLQADGNARLLQQKAAARISSATPPRPLPHKY